MLFITLLTFSDELINHEATILMQCIPYHWIIIAYMSYFVICQFVLENNLHGFAVCHFLKRVSENMKTSNNYCKNVLKRFLNVQNRRLAFSFFHTWIHIDLPDWNLFNSIMVAVGEHCVLYNDCLVIKTWKIVIQ